MELPSRLHPPSLDETLVARLAELADRIDGARPGQWEEDLAAFNKLAGTAIPFEEFQGIHGGEDPDQWVRRLMYHQYVASITNLSQKELVEVVSRVKRCDPDCDFYLELFLANCNHPSKSDLIFWPGKVPGWSDKCEPTAEEIGDMAMRDWIRPMIVRIDCGRITDEESFHAVFAEVFGFPEFYGQNMNAWIDCMGYLDSPEAGMTSIHVSVGQVLTLHLDGIDDFAVRCPDLYAALIECVAFVNWRRSSEGTGAILALAYYKNV